MASVMMFFLLFFFCFCFFYIITVVPILFCGLLNFQYLKIVDYVSDFKYNVKTFAFTNCLAIYVFIIYFVLVYFLFCLLSQQNALFLSSLDHMCIFSCLTLSDQILYYNLNFRIAMYSCSCVVVCFLFLLCNVM